MIYPVGICVEFATNINPNDVFIGQEWIRDAKGMVTVGVDEEDEDFNVINKIGGEKEHVLTVEELPSHNHSINRCTDGTSGTNGTKLRYAMYNAVFLDSSSTSYVGSNKPHNNLQPYITRYKWVRIK